jgi:hypothetical protein
VHLSALPSVSCGASPDSSAPKQLKEAAKRAIGGDYNQYAATLTAPLIYGAAVAEKARTSDSNVTPDLYLVELLRKISPTSCRTIRSNSGGEQTPRATELASPTAVVAGRLVGRW